MDIKPNLQFSVLCDDVKREGQREGQRLYRSTFLLRLEKPENEKEVEITDMEIKEEDDQ